jgi:transposase-like protein
MPYSYVRKTDPPNSEVLQNCVAEIQRGSRISAAARQFGLSETTVRRHLTAANQCVTLSHHGQHSSLPQSLAVEISAIAKAAARHGFRLSKRELTEFVGEIVRSRWDSEVDVGVYLRRYCRFTNHIPGSDFVV